MKTVLIIDDDVDHNTFLAEEIATLDNVAVVTAVSLESAEQALRESPSDLLAMLVDTRLPDGDGRDWCKRVRESGSAVPMILISGLTAEQDIVRGLESGADAYVRKPFKSAEILARLRTLLARDTAPAVLD